MNDSKDIATERLTQTISLIAESIAIATLFITLMLFISRLVICIFYRLPTVYNSLSLLKSIPFGLSVLCGTYFGMVSSNLLLNNNKESNKKDNDEKDEKMQIKITGAFWMSVLVFIQERIMWLISRTSKTDTKTKKKTVIDVIRKFYKTKIRNSTPQSAIIHLPILYIILIALNILWIDLSQILLKHEMWIIFVLGKIALFFFWVSISCIFALYIVSYTKEIINISENEIEENDNGNTTSKADLQIRLRTIAVGVLIVFIVSAAVVTSNVLSLTSKKKYGIVETINDKGIQKFAIVLDLDDFYIVEPASEIDSDLLIDAKKYMYMEKSDVLVTQKRYSRVMIVE